MAEAKIYITQNGKNMNLFFTCHVMAIHSQALFVYLKPYFKKDKIYNIWIDFNNCDYIDSTTVGTLIIIHNELKKIDKELVLCNLSSETESVLKTMGLVNYFKIINLETFKNLSENLKEQISVKKDNKLSSEFVLDAHKSIVQISPEMEKEFQPLFTILNQEIQKDKNKK